MRRLTYNEVAVVKQAILSKKQGGACAFCGRSMLRNLPNACLDHNHDTGQIRGVLCRTCNGFEGKLDNLFIRWARTADRATFLSRVLAYWDQYSPANNPHMLLYPSFKNDEEKRVLRNLKARKKRAAAKAAKK